ncbi:MAG: MotA/TolQ/ExbB proton channel family protein [Nitrospinota bacterium]|nr:MotA/TolQ/ExbB proton channel family protein [Nitrospinota bacterium]
MNPAPITTTHTGSVADMVVNSGPVGMLVLTLLLLFSVFSWAIIIYKIFSFKGIREETNEFVNVFSKKKSLESIYNTSRGMKSCPMARVFFAGYAEFASQFKASGIESAEGDKRFFLNKLDSIGRSLERAVAEEITRMERFLFFLATTGSTAPFVGLFGTVWGIMKAFQSVGLTGSSNIAVVAPGIAEALIATAAGLLAAVPAVIGYNYISHRIKVFASEMDNFSLDFLSLIDKNFVKR